MFTELIVYILATWRLARLLTSEQGPYDVFDRLRHKIGISYDDEGEPHGANVVAEAVMCLWCLSIWIGLGVAIAYYVAPTVTFWVTLPLALSAGAVIVNEVIDG